MPFTPLFLFMISSMSDGERGTFKFSSPIFPSTCKRVKSASLVMASSSARHSRLISHVFSDYDRRIRPLAENGSAVRVHMTIVLGILIEMRENEQVAAYVISHTQRWRDPKLSWEPAEHHNITELILPTSMIWLPKIFVYNSMDTKDMLSMERNDVRVDYRGNVKINIPQFVTCICRLEIEQFCAVALASPLLTSTEMEVTTSAPPKESYFSGNAEWRLINVTVRHLNYLEEGEYRAEVHYIFHLRRRPIFYITVIVMPIFLISVLSVLGIFTPGSSEGPRSEKVSLGLGSLLAMTVLLGIVAGAMPKSNSIPLLGYYILAVIVLCAIAVGLSTIFMALQRRLVEASRIPSSTTYRMSLVKPKLLSTATASPKPSALISTNGRGLRSTLARRGPYKFSSISTYGGTPPSRRTGSFFARFSSWQFSQQVELQSMLRISEEAEDRCDPINEVSSTIHDNPSRHSATRQSAKCNGQVEHAAPAGPSNSNPVSASDASTKILLFKIHELLAVIADSQLSFRRKLERQKNRELIEKEWSRVFLRIDYGCLIVFEILNCLSLFFLLRYAWSDSPDIREPLV